MVYIFLADGFEEIEALAPLDIMRRADIDVKTVGVTGEWVTGAHGITVKADILPADVNYENLDCVILPGGLPGTTNLEKDDKSPGSPIAPIPRLYASNGSAFANVFIGSFVVKCI